MRNAYAFSELSKNKARTVKEISVKERAVLFLIIT
jgi:hypothetical protein